MPRIMNKAVWPYQKEVAFQGNEHSDAMYKWCEEKIPRWYLNGNTFCFDDEKEYLMFCLRWAS